jgi:putative ABC transport system substrate-binding protein
LARLLSPRKQSPLLRDGAAVEGHFLPHAPAAKAATGPTSSRFRSAVERDIVPAMLIPLGADQMAIGIVRRQFITVLGGATFAWPLAARAQQSVMPTIGFLRSEPLADAMHLVTAFRAGLKETGYIEHRNVTIELRSAEGHADRLPALVTELLHRPVAVIVANSIAAVAAATITTTVPIVFATGTDPVRDHLVASLNNPGGNVTGVVFFASTLGAKRWELLRQLVPKATTVAMLVKPNTSESEAERRDVLAAAQSTGQQLLTFDASNEREIETAFATAVQRGAGALLVGSGPFFNSQREYIVSMAARYALPTCHQNREAVLAGGLMSYGTSITDAYRQAGIYTGRILKGEKPADLPVMQPTKFELVINLKTAKMLGLTVPQSLLVAADEVIE